MEILCSEMNRMDKNCPAALNLGAARTCVRGKRMAVRPRKVWWESVEVKFEPCVARASGGSRISYQLPSTFRAFNSAQKRPSAAKWENRAAPQRRNAPTSCSAFNYSTAIFAPRWPAFDNRSIRLSITARIPFRNSMREFVKCSRTSGDTPKHSRN